MTLDPLSSQHHTAAAGLGDVAMAAVEAVQEIVAESADALLVVDELGIVRFVNPAAEELFRRSTATLVDQPFGFPVVAGKAADLEILRPDGEVIIVEMRTRPIRWSGGSAHLAALRDITNRKRTEQMLIESQQVLRAALDTLPANLAILDSSGMIIATNAAWQAFARANHVPVDRSAVGANYVAAHSASTAEHPRAAEVASGVWAVLKGEEQRYGVEYMVESSEGQRWMAIHAVACGEIGWARAVLTHEEITARKQRESLEADRRQVLELVARQHSLATVITGLLAMAQNRYPDLVYGALALRGPGVFRSLGPAIDEDSLASLDRWAGLQAAAITSIAGGEPAIQVSRPFDASWEELHRPVIGFGISRCWRTPFHLGGLGAQGQMILCRSAEAEPTAADLAFVELVGQLLAIAVEQHERTRQLAHQAHHDTLTGLPNRLLFEDRLRQALENARRTHRMVAILFIDLDRFKQVNDGLGHAVGDTLLVQLARRFEGCVRATDTLARRGGDEFMLVLPEIASAQQVTRVARRLHDMLRMPFLVDGHELFLSASIGASLYPDDGEDSDALQRSADAAMYRAKGTLRNSFQFYDATMNRVALERLQLETHLRRAIERGELGLYYQPKVDRHGRLAGAEALLRWNHPELGQIPPARFIPLAEELGLIVPIGEWCLAEICRQASQWQRRGLPPLRLAANVSALQFAQPGFISAVSRILAESDLDPFWLELELTESMLMGDVEAVTRQLGELRSLRLTMAIDDFGTGFSSLVYLQRLPISVLKVDRSFVGRIGSPGDDNERGIVSAIITLGHQLHMELVAEGVETPAQLRFLQDIGCDLYQGYLFSEPLPPILFEHLFRDSPMPGALWRA